MRVAVVGAGPGGSSLAWRLAKAGIEATVFDPSHPREKPCGGGLTAKALALLPEAPADDPLPARTVDACRFEADAGPGVDVALGQPVAIVARREFDAWLLRRAVAAGARHRTERVVEVDAEGRVRTPFGEDRFDVIAGADGAGSLVRRTFLKPTPPERLMIAAGWFSPGTSPMLVRFLAGLHGYLWLFPRRDHVGVGICAPLRAVPTRDLLARLEHEAYRSFPALTDPDHGRYAHTIPSPDGDPASIAEIAGERWALVGDAAALADPITGEGIHPALRSAETLARTLVEEGSSRRYPERLLAEWGHELLKAARLQARFWSPGFTTRMVRLAQGSAAVRDVLADLVLGDQGYGTLKRRLLRESPRVAWQAATHAVRTAL